MTTITRRGTWAVLMLVAILASLLAMVPTASATVVPVTVQMVVCVDVSNSIDAGELTLMVNGLADAVENPDVVPQNGSVELGINMFGWGTEGHPEWSKAEIVVGMTVVDSQATATAIANSIRGIQLTYGWTPTGKAIDQATAMMTGSTASFSSASRHIINITTDGVPAGDPDENETPGGRFPLSEAKAVVARNAAIAAGITGIHAEMVGVDVPGAVEWMRTQIVYPQPGVLAPPFIDTSKNGFVIEVAKFEDYAAAIKAKFQALFLKLTLEPLTDLNDLATQKTHEVVATLLDGNGDPVVGATVNFEILSGPHAGKTGSAVTIAGGKASWTYTGSATGLDTIVATSGDLTSNTVTKEWIDSSEPGGPVPSVTTWGLIGTVFAVAALGMLMLYRRQASVRS